MIGSAQGPDVDTRPVPPHEYPHYCEAKRLRSSGQSRSCRVDLRVVSKKQNLVACLKFFVWAWIDNICAVAFDADDARAGLSAELQLANEFPRCRGISR